MLSPFSMSGPTHFLVRGFDRDRSMKLTVTERPYSPCKIESGEIPRRRGVREGTGLFHGGSKVGNRESFLAEERF